MAVDWGALDPRLRRALERAEAREATRAPEGASEWEMTPEEAALSFAGTDLPADQVLKVLWQQACWVAQQAGVPGPAVHIIAGSLLACFLAGYFAREEVERG